MIIIIYI